MKKIIKSALVSFAVAAAAFLNSGCNEKTQSPASPDDILGDWHIEFHEPELGGNCSMEYSFLDNGELIFSMICDEGKVSTPMLWRTEGNKLYAIQKDIEKFYEEEKLEWLSVDYKISGSTLEFYEEGRLTATFKRKNQTKQQ